MKELKIEQLKRECKDVEYKKAKGGFPSSFYETYSSFCNTNGGVIYLGLEETVDYNFISSRLSIEEAESLVKDLFSTLNNKNKVNYNLISNEDVEILTYDGFYVVKITVKKACREYLPIYINNNILTGSYIRKNEGDFHCNPQEIRGMLRDAEDKSQDIMCLENLGIDTICMDSVMSYKNRLQAVHPDHVFLKGSLELLLEFIGAIRLGNDGKMHPTKAGLLMFGYAYKIVYEFPEYFLDFQDHHEDINDVRWVDRVVSDSGEWSGNLFDFYFSVINKLSTSIKTPFNMEGITRKDNTSMHQAVREALCNAMSNADFYFPKGIVVKNFHDTIIFSNPGRLRISKEQAFIGGESDARNKTILKMFNLIGIGERAGSGIPKILAACHENNYSIPKLVEDFDPDRTTLTIEFKPFKLVRTEEEMLKDSKLDERKRKVLSYLGEYPDSKVIDISNELGCSVSTVKHVLYSLLDSGSVQSKGTIKDKRYRLKEENSAS